MSKIRRRHSTNAESGKDPGYWCVNFDLDVTEWEFKVERGVQGSGLAAVVQFPKYRLPIFEIRDKGFVDGVRAALRNHQ